MKELWQTKELFCAKNQQPTQVSRDHVWGLSLPASLFYRWHSSKRPLISFPLLPTELKSTGTAHHFSFLLNSTDYRILRMDEDHDRMYVGSKDYILSLDLNDINKEPLIVRSLPRRQQ